jgi:mono/diheme cytochrome c family protein
MRPTHLLTAAALLTAFSAAGAGDSERPKQKPAPKPHDEQVRPFLARHCVGCHGPEKPKGGLRLDQLAADFADPAVREKWEAVRKRLDAGDMPPRSKPRPPQKEIEAVSAWIKRSADGAIARRAAEGRVVLRRLNRVEYENTMRDLLGIDVELQALLPEDGSAHGFDNVGEALHVSSFLMERYLEAADKSLNLAIANGPQPPKVKKRLSIKDSHHVKTTTERVFRVADDGTVTCFSSSAWNAIVVSGVYPPDRGRYRFRIGVSAVQSGKKPVSFRVDAGPMLMATKNHLVGYFDVPPGKQTVVEFVDHLEARSTIRIHPHGLGHATAVHKVGADKWEGPGLAVHWVEVEGPLHDSWPPPSHKAIFGDLEQKPAPRYNASKRVEVVSKDPETDAKRILSNFARRAFRRSVTDEDVGPFLKLVKKKLAEKRSFEQAVRAGLLAVLTSPEFLFLREKPGRLDDFALASRLSYFLWSTTPDEELLTLAEKKKLGEKDALAKQVERMLKSPKARAFTENFVDQWLGLREIDFTIPSHLLYPEYDDLLRASMMQETHLFFDEVLKDDLSLTNFVSSDFTMLNERLAGHYGIDGVVGQAFRKVKLPPKSRRGGVMTMASVLKVTANGTTTSPVTRGAWVLDRILGAPPAPPPSGVAALEPDVRGATTIREQLAKHRQDKTCAKCHSAIDPAGFALESFDVIGGWRDNYRTLGNGKEVKVSGRRMPYREGKKVDPADEFEGGKFADVDDFKRLLLKDPDRLASALTVKLLTYATGGSPLTLQKEDVEAIVKAAREKKYGLRSLVHALVQSKAFRHK